MSRSLAAIAKQFLSVPCAIALAACSNSSDDAKPSGGGTTQQLPVTVNAGFGAAATPPVVVGTPPFSAQFTGGSLPGSGQWVIAEGQTATVDFTTPAEQVNFETVPGASGSAPGVAS